MAQDGSIFSRLGDIVEDLVTLEINTVVKPNMTARKMPTPRHAIIDIAQDFSTELERSNPDVLEWQLACDVETFDTIRSEARRQAVNLLDKQRFEPLGEDEQRCLVLLRRIMRNSDQIKGLLTVVARRDSKALAPTAGFERLDRQAIIASSLPSLPLQPEERLVLRKIWEVGVETVVLQTTVLLDGDVLTRMRPDLDDATYGRLKELHNQSVTISLTMWKTLIETAHEFLKLFIPGRFQP